MDDHGYKTVFIGIPVDDRCQQQINAALLERSDIANEALMFRPHITLGKIHYGKHRFCPSSFLV